MAQIIADYALYNQAIEINEKTNAAEINLYVLQKNKTKAKIFSDSFKYYLSKPSDIDDIYNQAQQVILALHKDLPKYIEKKEQETSGELPLQN